MINKKKIIFDATILGDGNINNAARSGIFFVALNILEQLIQRKDVELVLWVSNRHYCSLKDFVGQRYPLLNLEIYTDEISTKFDYLYYRLKTKKAKAKLGHNMFEKFYIQQLLLLVAPFVKIAKNIASLFINNNKDSILQSFDIYFSPAYKVAEKFANIKGVKKFVLLHDTIPNVLPEYSSALKDNGWYSKLIETLNGNDYYFANSEYTRQDFLKYFPQIDSQKIKTTLLACSNNFKFADREDVERARKKYNIPADKKYVFSLCTLEPRKNLVRTVKTFIQFIKKHDIDDLVFVLGGGHWKHFIGILENEIKDLGDYQDKILKIGYVDDADLPALYSGAEWFTYTSQYEGFGLPPLEAMSCGCPVITSNNSSLPEVVGDAGVMIDWDSDEQHIEAYEKYYFNEELRKEYAQKGLERAKQFSWKKCVDEMLEVMKNDL